MQSTHYYHSNPSVSTTMKTSIKKDKLAMVILDWDDTLYPTTYLVKNNCDISMEQFINFGKILYEFFSTYIELFGHENIYIVTNGDAQWVLKSLIQSSKCYQQQINDNDNDNNNKEKKDYFAAIYNSFLRLKIKIISASRLYSIQFPKKSIIWKCKVFTQIANKQYFNINNHICIIISIGDSDNEYIAAREAKCLLIEQNIKYGKNNIIRLHRVKLKKKPSMNQIVKQLTFLIKESKNMHQEKGSISVQFT